MASSGRHGVGLLSQFVRSRDLFEASLNQESAKMAPQQFCKILVAPNSLMATVFNCLTFPEAFFASVASSLNKIAGFPTKYERLGFASKSHVATVWALTPMAPRQVKVGEEVPATVAPTKPKFCLLCKAVLKVASAIKIT